MTTGHDKEREFVNALEYEGALTMRAGASGSGGERPLPDVHFARNGRTYACELKYGDPPLYFTYEEIDELERFAREFGSQAYGVARFKGDRTFYMVHVRRLPHSQGESYVLRPGTAEDKAFREVVPE